jgi:hypothetical protein
MARLAGINGLWRWALLGGTLGVVVVAACSSDDASRARATVPPVHGAGLRASLGAVRPAGRLVRTWQPTSAGLEAVTSNLSLVVSPDGVYLGSRASTPSTASPRLSLSSLGRDGAVSLQPAQPSPQGQRVVIDRGLAEEHLDLNANFVEQSWSFARQPPGSGDLVVKLRTHGLRGVGADQSGLHFRAGEQRFSYSVAKWIDATGRSNRVDTRLHRGEIVLTVPAQVVEASAYPALLDPTISAEIVLDTGVRNPGGALNNAVAACGPAQCLAVWHQADWLVGRRLSREGAPLDANVFPIGFTLNGAVSPLVSASDSGDYLVAWNVDGSGYATFVSAADGSLSDSPPVTIFTNDALMTLEAATFSDGAHHVLYHQRVDTNVDQRFVQRIENDLPTFGGGIDLGKPATLNNVSFNAGGQQLLYAIKNQVQRVDLTGDGLLDATPIEISKLAYGVFASDVSSAFDGENHVVVWIDSGKLYAARLRASDGQLLDPDDDIAMLPGARVMCQIGAASRPRASIAGGRLSVSWQSATELHAASFALTPWASSNAACGGATGFDFAALSPLKVSLAGAAGVALVTDDQIPGLRAVGFALSNAGAVTTTNEGLLNYNGGDLNASRLLSNGRDFLVGSAQFERIDGVTGERLDRGPRPERWSDNIVSNGTDYVGTVNHSGLRRLRCDGTLGPTYSTGHHLTSLGCDGERCLGTAVTVRGMGPPSYLSMRRLTARGEPIGDWTELFDDPGSSIVSVVGADTSSDVAARSFVVVAIQGNSLLAIPVAGATGVVGAPVKLVDAAPVLLAPTNEGSHVLISWTYLDKTWLTVLDPATGVPLVGPQQQVFPQQGYLHPVQPPSFDGTSYVSFHREFTPAHYMNRMDRLDPGLGLVGPASGVDLGQSIPMHLSASNLHGRTLATYNGFSPELLAGTINAHFIDNDLSVEDPNDAPANCAPSPAGGAGGADPGSGGADPGSGGADPGSGGADPSSGGADPSSGGAGDGPDAQGGAAGASGSTAGASSQDEGGAGGSSAGEAHGGSATFGGAGMAGSSAGAPATGGDPSSSGHGPGSGGTSSAGTDGGSGEDHGCSCRVPASSRAEAWPFWLLAGVALGRRRRGSGR